MYQVLLVDKDTHAAIQLRRCIDWEAHGCSVIGAAGSAGAALDYAQKQRPDIIFCDIPLPDGNGLDLLAQLRTQCPHLQISVLTACDDIRCAQRAFRLDVARYLLKPCGPEEVEEALESMLDRLPQALAARPRKVDTTSFIVRQATGYILENCTRNLSLQEVAKICCVSKWHLSKLLAGTGHTFYELLNQARIDRAKLLLADHALHIGDIAAKVGYRDASHFGRVFKALEGKPASVYRNELL